MFNLDDIGARAFAAAASLTISAVFLAIAILPGSQNALGTGVIA